MLSFPIPLVCNIDSANGTLEKSLTLVSPFTCILGPNGAGKTHLLRSLRSLFANSHEFNQLGKTRLISAGRMGVSEQYRSDALGHYSGDHYNFESDNFGAVSDGVRRHHMQSINGDIHTLSIRHDIRIKVQERLRKLFKRDIEIVPDGGVLKVYFSKLDGYKKYTSSREASGLMHLVGILSALYDDEVKFLLIDEPEVSLHPQLQSFLLGEMLDVSINKRNKIVIIATHSPSMINIQSVNDLFSLVFCDDLDQPLKQLTNEMGELQGRNIKSLVSRLGQEHKMTFFCKRPLLVEGPSDVVICNALAAKLQMYLEASGCQFLPVIGKDQLPIVYKLLVAMGKEPLILADADSIVDTTDFLNKIFNANPSVLDIIVTEIGVDPFDLVRKVDQELIQLINNEWDAISSFAMKQSYWILGHKDDENKAKKRACFTLLFNLRDSEFEEIPNFENWSKLKTRYITLLRVLEKIGVFVLRKGAIESYYPEEYKVTNTDKIEVAFNQIDNIHSGDLSSINESYADIIRFLEMASAYIKISEIEAVRQILLSALAPCIDGVKNENNMFDLNTIARNNIGEKANLFNIEKNEDNIVVSLNSKILNIPGFPLTIHKDCNLNSTLLEKLME
ncbi:ATP-dependent nuclease [Acinetobacter baumannii]